MAYTPKGTGQWDILELDATSLDWRTYENVDDFNVDQITEPAGTKDYRLLGAVSWVKAYMIIDLDVPGHVSLPDSFTAHFKFSIERMVPAPNTLENAETANPNPGVFLYLTKDTYRTVGINISDNGIGYIGGMNWNRAIADTGQYITAESGWYDIYLAHSAAQENSFLVVRTPSGKRFEFAYTSRKDIGKLTSLVLYVTGYPDKTIPKPNILFRQLRVGTGVFLDWRAPVTEIPADRGFRIDSGRDNYETLDGTRSRDVLGAGLSYSWELLNAPEASTASAAYYDGWTEASADPYTSTLKSTSAAGNVAAGAYIVFNNGFYRVTSVLADAITIDSQILPTGTINLMFRVISQTLLDHTTTPFCQLAIDKPGQFIARLTSNNGRFASSAETSIMARTSDAKVGEFIDASWIWSYLSDVWQRVEDKGPITEYFNALEQHASSLLTQAYQAEIDQNITTAQPFHSYRWMVLDMRIRETGDTNLISGHASISVQWADWSSQSFTVRFHSGANPTDISITFPAGMDTVEKTVQYLNTQFANYDIQAHRYNFSPSWVYLTSTSRIEITAGTVFTIGHSNLLEGTAGEIRGLREYKLDRSIIGLTIQKHFVVIRGEIYPITGIKDTTSPRNLIEVGQDLPLELKATQSVANWIIPHFWNTETDYHGQLAFSGDSANLLAYDTNNDEQEVADTVIGVLEKQIGTKSLIPTNPYYQSCILSSITRTFYYPVDSAIQSVPRIQLKVEPTANTDYLYQGEDFVIQSYRGEHCIRFGYYDPPTYVSSAYQIQTLTTLDEQMFAEEVVVDNKERIENNFSSLVGLEYSENITVDVLRYLAAVRGLWFVFSKGRTIENLKRAVNVFFALSWCQSTGTITEISYYANLDYGRMVVQDKATPTLKRTYLLFKSSDVAINPRTKKLWVVGDEIQKYERISGGAAIQDMVSSPNFYKTFQELGVAPEEANPLTAYHKFLVTVDAKTFTPERYTRFMEFVEKWQPKYLTPFVIMLQHASDGLEIRDATSMALTVQFTDNPIQFWTLMFDDYDATGNYYKFDDGYKFDTWGDWPNLAVYAVKGYTFAGNLKYDTVLRFDDLAFAWKYDQTYTGLVESTTILEPP